MSGNQPNIGSTIESGNISNTNSYIYYRFIVYQVLNNSGLAGQPEGACFSNINISGITLNEKGILATGISSLGTGQYSSIINKAFNNNQGNIFINNNYGIGDFVDTQTQATNNGTWQSITMSCYIWYPI